MRNIALGNNALSMLPSIFCHLDFCVHKFKFSWRFCQGIQNLSFQFCKMYKSCQTDRSDVGKCFCGSRFCGWQQLTKSSSTKQSQKRLKDEEERMRRNQPLWCKRKQTLCFACRKMLSSLQRVWRLHPLCRPRAYNTGGSSFARLATQIREARLSFSIQTTPSKQNPHN